nr:hypothetical protein [Tanacetum cinerariifolium]
MGEKVFHVNADLLCNAISITPKDLDHPFTLPFPDDWSYWEEFQYQIESRKVSKQKKELMFFLRFSKLIVNYILSKHDQILKRPLPFHHVIKLDSALRNLKFVNKGSKVLIFGMDIRVVMLNDGIKASVEYLEYLAKSRGAAPSEGIDDDEVDSKETNKDEEQLVRTRPSGKAIGRGVQREYKEEIVDHSKKLKGLDTLSCERFIVTPEVLDELVIKSSKEEAGVSLEIVNAKKDTKDQVAEERGVEK